MKKYADPVIRSKTQVLHAADGVLGHVHKTHGQPRLPRGKISDEPQRPWGPAVPRAHGFSSEGTRQREGGGREGGRVEDRSGSRADKRTEGPSRGGQVEGRWGAGEQLGPAGAHGAGRNASGRMLGWRTEHGVRSRKGRTLALGWHCHSGEARGGGAEDVETPRWGIMFTTIKKHQISLR